MIGGSVHSARLAFSALWTRGCRSPRTSSRRPRGSPPSSSCSHVLAQVLVRRGLGDPDAARTFLAADVKHGLDEWPGLAEVAAAHPRPRPARLADHRARRLRRGRRDARRRSSCARCARSAPTWTGTCRRGSTTATASRCATVEKLAARGTNLLITVDCAVTAVEEVAAARALGLDVDRHRPSLAARGRHAAGRADRAPARQRLPVRRPVRGGRRVQARAGAARRQRRGPELGRRGPGPGRAGHGRRRRAAAGREPPARARGAEGARRARARSGCGR